MFLHKYCNTAYGLAFLWWKPICTESHGSGHMCLAWAEIHLIFNWVCITFLFLEMLLIQRIWQLLAKCLEPFKCRGATFVLVGQGSCKAGVPLDCVRQAPLILFQSSIYEQICKYVLSKACNLLSECIINTAIETTQRDKGHNSMGTSYWHENDAHFRLLPHY